MQILFKPSVRRPLSVLILLGMDTLTLFGGLITATYAVAAESRIGQIIFFAPVLLAVWLAIFAAHDLYDRASKRRNFGAILRANLLGGTLLVIGSIVYPQSGFHFREMTLAVIFIMLLNLGLRLSYE